MDVIEMIQARRFWTSSRQSKRRLLTASLFLAFAVPLGAVPALGQTWDLIWSDEFNYAGAPDPSKWGYDIGGGGWGNQELQAYTDLPENSRVDGDHLIIEARTNGSSYSSARLVSRGKASWRYGRFEVRAQIPRGVGTWSGIWMLPEDNYYGIWPNSGEIDIVEHVGKDEGTMHASLHMLDRRSYLGNNPTGTVQFADGVSAFHEYAVEWTPAEIRFYYDDQLVQIVAPGVAGSGFYRDAGAGWQTWPFDQPFHLLFNVAVGGNWGGPDVDAGAFPTQMLIDYVRVYENAGTLPQVSLTPSAVTASPGSTIILDGEASDPDGQLELVTIRQGDVVLANLSAGPFDLELADVQEGCYSVTMEARDTEGWTSRTEPIALTVGSTCGKAPATISPQKIPGQIEMESYDLGGNGVGYFELDNINTGVFRTEESVDIAARYETGGHYLTGLGNREWTEYTVQVDEGVYEITAQFRGEGRFELSLDGAAIGSFNLPQSPDWSNASLVDVDLPAGLHVLRFSSKSTGYEIDGLTFVETGAVPTVVLNSPSDGGTIQPGETLEFSATATDRDDDLDQVTFFQGIAPIASVSAPFAYTLAGVSAGCYEVSAVARDARGNRSDPANASVTVASCGRAPYLMRPAAIPGVVTAAFFDLGDAYSDLTAGAGVFRPESVDIEWDEVEGYFVGNIASREWLGYTVEVAKSVLYDVQVRVFSAVGGAIQLEENGTDVSGRLDFSATGGSWETQAFTG
ncbi:MAG: beta-glucanase (GH16 family), partial [Thalassolituus oleivorans]